MTQTSTKWRLLAAVVAVSAVAFLLSPRPPSLGPETTGDAALARAVRQAADGGAHRGLAVALIENGRIRLAGVGVTGGPASSPVSATTAFEIGSITKAMTGMLLAELKVPAGTKISELLPAVRFEHREVADATLAELASHRAGLPRVPTTPKLLALSYLFNLTGLDPYRGTGPRELLADAASASASERGQVSYSNIGMAVLGLALAESQGVPYGELLRTRILQPLGMSATAVLGPGDPLPAGRAHGSKANGMPMDPWRGHGYNPAGVGVWSTARDLAVLVKAVMDGSAPGAEAAEPRFADTPKQRVGYGWFTTDFGGRQVTWHNGGTGGFSGFAGFDRAAGRGVVVLGNTDASVDALALRLLGADPSDREDSLPILMLLVTLVLTFSPGLEAWFGRRPHELTAAASKVLWGLFSLLLAWAVGPWSILPPVAWALGAGLLAGGVLRWRGLSFAPAGPWPWVRIAIPILLGIAWLAL
ncbi:serine hydrolase domain-containing protein [Thermoactinospora rubra]|uniref:serine hydrolase domain-containing protein n=1 Tax=Thermoactinospora rubra TaxID=1088767 RepID=UPI000A0F8939|nr:serine hydrolase domain-containing protein [Thermoactinospora rubra]